MNDKSEFKIFNSVLKTVIDELDYLDQPYILDNILDSVNNDYHCLDIVDTVTTNAPEMLNNFIIKMRQFSFFVLCFSNNDDSLNIWNYYVKDNKDQGYNLGISTKEFLNELRKLEKLVI